MWRLRARFLTRISWPCCARPGAGALDSTCRSECWSLARFSVDGGGTDPEEPAGGARAVATRWISMCVSRMGRGGTGFGGSLQEWMLQENENDADRIGDDGIFTLRKPMSEMTKSEAKGGLAPVAQKFILHWGEMGWGGGISRAGGREDGRRDWSPGRVPATEMAPRRAAARPTVGTRLRE